MTAVALRAFHGDPAIKRKYLARLRAHRRADELIHGVYWQNGKGCAVGCTIHSDQHSAYESELGIPVVLAYLEDRMFETLTNGRAKDWPIRFLEAIPVGADLSGVVSAFLLWMMLDETFGVAFMAEDSEVADLAAEVGLRYAAGDTQGDEAEDLARRLWDARAAWAAWAARDTQAAWAAQAARAAFVVTSTEHLLELLAMAPVPTND